jgi:hypothetical protein
MLAARGIRGLLVTTMSQEPTAMHSHDSNKAICVRLHVLLHVSCSCVEADGIVSPFRRSFRVAQTPVPRWGASKNGTII